MDPIPAPTVTEPRLLLCKPALGPHRTDVSEIHSLRSQLLPPDLGFDDTSTVENMAPWRVKLAEPVEQARLIRTPVLNAPPAYEADPDKLPPPPRPAVKITRKLRSKPLARRDRMDVSECQVEASQLLAPFRDDEEKSLMEIPAPARVTLKVPVETAFLRVITLTITPMYETDSEILPVRLDIVIVDRQLLPEPCEDRHVTELCDSQVLVSHLL